MSREYPCVYYKNGECRKFYTSDNIHRCVLGPCKYQTPTNADRIRSLSDEELINFFELEVNACPPDTYEYKWCDTDDDCKRCWLEWLQQPYISEDIKSSEYIEKDIEGDA